MRQLSVLFIFIKSPNLSTQVNYYFFFLGKLNLTLKVPILLENHLHLDQVYNDIGLSHLVQISFGSTNLS